MLPTFYPDLACAEMPETLELTLSVIPVGSPAHIFHTLNAHTKVQHLIYKVSVFNNVKIDIRSTLPEGTVLGMKTRLIVKTFCTL